MSFIRFIGCAAALATGLSSASLAAHAATVCSVTDIAPAVQACAGFHDGNLLNTSAANIAAQQAALGLIGLTWNGDFGAADKIDSLAGASNVDFATPLRGISYIGLHFGNGGPGNATAFYRLDGGSGLDVFGLRYAASSNAVLYATDTAPAVPGVPEMQAYALLLAGLAGVAFVTRRRSARR